MASLLDLDKQSFDFPCPRCGFFNEAYLGQVKLRDVIICRGCKTNIQLAVQSQGEMGRLGNKTLRLFLPLVVHVFVGC